MRGQLICWLSLQLLLPAGLSAQEPAPEPPAAPAVRDEVERAASLVRSGRTDAARDLLLEVLSSAPHHGGARVLLGRIEIERGALESAREHLEIAVRSDPPTPYLAWHLLGRVRLLQGEPQPALDAWGRALERAPRFTPARLGRARAALRSADLELAAADLARALEPPAPSPEAALLLAEIDLLRDRTAQASSTLAALAHSPEASPEQRLGAELLALAARPEPDLAELRAAVGRHPNVARGLLALGIAQVRADETEGAGSAFRAALATDDRDPVPWLYLRQLARGDPAPPYPRPFATLSRRLARAQRLIEQGDPEAEAELDAILERRPHHLTARLLLARAAELRADAAHEGRWEALDSYRRLLESFPSVPAIEAAAARTARAMGALELAACLAGRAARGLPQDGRTRYLLATVQAEAGRYARAAESCRAAIELGFGEAAAFVTLGFAEFESMNLDASIAAYARALALDPEAATAVPRFALASLTTEQFSGLRGLLEAHLLADPDHREALYSLGVMSLRENDLAAARDYFERLADLDPDDPQIHYNLGSVHLRQGSRERGEAAMARFRELKAIEAERWLVHNRAHALRLEAQAASAGGGSERAVEIYERMAEAGTAGPDDYLAAGHACLALADHRRAYGWFQRLLETDPYHREALGGLAEAARGLGRDEEARRALERAELLSWDCQGD